MATRTWNGGGGDNLWQTAANWDVLPVAGDALVFAGVVQVSTSNDFPAATSFASITFSATAGNFTLAGNSITLTGNITMTAGGGSPTLSLGIIFNVATVTIQVPNGRTMTLSGVLSETGGSRGLSKNALVGTLTISGTANTFSGVFNAGSGQTNAASIASVGAGASSLGAPTTVANGTIVLGANTLCTLNINGVGPFTSDRNFTNNNTSAAQANIRSNQTGGTLTLSGTMTNAGGATARGFALGGTGDLIVSGIISDGSAVCNVVKGFSGTTTLSGANTYTGATTINVGTLKLSGGNDRIKTTNTISVTGSGVLDITTISQTVATATFAAGTQLLAGVGPTTGLLTVTGTATVAGKAGVSSVTSPAFGNAYTILTAGTRTGTFQPAASLLTGGGRTFRISYPAQTVVLTDAGMPRGFMPIFNPKSTPQG